MEPAVVLYAITLGLGAVLNCTVAVVRLRRSRRPPDATGWQRQRLMLKQRMGYFNLFLGLFFAFAALSMVLAPSSSGYAVTLLAAGVFLCMAAVSGLTWKLQRGRSDRS